MTSKKDPPGTTSNPGAKSGSDKRPHATLDLKAVEVKGEPQQSPKSTAKGPSGAPDSNNKRETTHSTSSAPESSRSPVTSANPVAGAAGPGSKNGDRSASGRETVATGRTGAGKGPGTRGAKDAGGAPPQAASRERRRSAPEQPGRHSSYLGYVVSGLAGGVVALVGSYWASGQSAQQDPSAPVEQSVSALDTRISKLEQRTPETAASPVSDPALVQDIAKAQEKLAEELAGLSQRVAGDETGPDTGSRIAKLEERLEVMAGAANNSPQSERLPELAALTGKIAELEERMETEFARDADAPAAKAVNQQISQDLTALKREIDGIQQRLSSVTSERERTAESVDSLQSKVASLSAEVSSLRNSIESALTSVARPSDIGTAITPLARRLSDLETGISTLQQTETERRAGTRRVVLALELANLKRAMDEGRPFARELARVQEAGDGTLDLGTLRTFEDEGVPTVADLQSSFRPVIRAILDASETDADDSVIDRLVAGARSVVRVRKVGHTAEDTGVEATVARMEDALDRRAFDDVLIRAKELPAAVAAVAEEWLDKVKARQSVDAGIRSLEADLKTSLTSSRPPPQQPPGDQNQGGLEE